MLNVIITDVVGGRTILKGVPTNAQLTPALLPDCPGCRGGEHGRLASPRGYEQLRYRDFGGQKMAPTSNPSPRRARTTRASTVWTTTPRERRTSRACVGAVPGIDYEGSG